MGPVMARAFRVVVYGTQRKNPDVHRLAQIVILLARELAQRRDADTSNDTHPRGGEGD
jgi:hypothetical protein